MKILIINFSFLITNKFSNLEKKYASSILTVILWLLCNVPAYPNLAFFVLCQRFDEIDPMCYVTFYISTVTNLKGFSYYHSVTLIVSVNVSNVFISFHSACL